MSFDVDISLAIGRHSVAARIVSNAKLTVLVGPSGIGKTSTLNAIAGLVQPRAGRIVVAGRVLFDSEAGVALPPEQRGAGYVFQDMRLFPHRTVAGNLSYGERLAKHGERFITRDDLVQLLEIGDLLERYPATLSGGEMRRVAIGRALLSAPRFLLLDEPVSSLDPARTETLLALIEWIRDTLDLPILLVSHSVAEGKRLAGTIVELADRSSPPRDG